MQEEAHAGPAPGVAAPTKARYSTGWGRLIASPLYRATLGSLSDSRAGRLLLLCAVPLIWLVVFDLGPVFQLARISLMSQYPIVHEGGSALTLDNFRVFFAEPLYFTPLIRSVIFAFAVTAVTLLLLAVTGALAARLGGASIAKGAARVVFWGGLAMAATAAIGSLFGTAPVG